MSSPRGQLAGVLPDAHQFEFRAIDRGIIKGRVDRSLSAEQLIKFNKEWVGADAVALIHVKRVLRKGEVLKETFLLRALEHPKDTKGG